METGRPSKTITNQILIKGIFREISVLAMHCRFTAEGTTHEVRIQIPDDSDRKISGTDILRLTAPAALPKAGTLRFEFESSLFEAELTSQESGSNEYHFPTALTQKEHRTRKRLKARDLSDHAVIADIRGPGARWLGYVNELSSDELGIMIPQSAIAIQPNDLVTLRLQLRGLYTFSGECRVMFVRQHTDQVTELIVTPLDSQKEVLGTQQREQRVDPLRQDPLLLRWPDAKGLSIDATIKNRSLFGLACQISKGSQLLPPVGSICVLPESGLRARIAWKDRDYFGLDLRVNPKPSLQKWISQTDASAKGSAVLDLELKHSKRLLSIFLRSGFLKGQRATPFSGLQIEDLIPIERESLEWIRRYSGSTSGEHTDYHVSFLRISDLSWLIQELGQSSEQTGNGETILDSSISFFSSQEDIEKSPSSVLMAIYDPKSRFNVGYWDSTRFKEQSYVSSVAVLPVKALSKVCSNNDSPNYGLIEPSPRNWLEVRSNLANQFDSRLLAGVGLGSDDFDSPHFKQTLAYKGILLQRKTAVLTDNGKVCGALVQTGLPPLSNVSGLADALFVLLQDNVDESAVLKWLWDNHQRAPLLNGITDLLVIKNSLKCFSEATPDIRQFRVRCIPIYSLSSLSKGEAA